MNLLTSEYLKTLIAYNKLWIGFSGGVDSTVLLHVLTQNPLLKSKVHAIHFNHNLHLDAKQWEGHCQGICKLWDIPLDIYHLQIKGKENLEERARELRYQQFISLVQANDALILGHHHDDQAETLLLQLFRGAGIEGLSAMAALRDLPNGKLIRPFLQRARADLIKYAENNNLIWIEDPSNQQVHFARNFIRHEVIPLIEKRWPKVKSALNRTAFHVARAGEHLATLAANDSGQSLNNPYLHLDSIKELSHEKLNNILRTWLKNQGVKMPSTLQMDILINEVIFAGQDRNPEIVGDGYTIRRYKNKLYFVEPLKEASKDYVIKQALLELENKGFYNSLALPISVRFRKGGETIIFRKQRKNLKKLFQELQIPPWERDQIPLIYIGDELSIVVGYIMSDFLWHNL